MVSRYCKEQKPASVMAWCLVGHLSVACGWRISTAVNSWLVLLRWSMGLASYIGRDFSIVFLPSLD